MKKQMHRKITPEDGVLDFPDLIQSYPATEVPVQVETEDLAALLYTGGTTGLSKGVMLTPRQLHQRGAAVPHLDDHGRRRQGVGHRHLPLFPYRRLHRHDEHVPLLGVHHHPGAAARAQDRPGHDPEIPPELFRVRAHHFRGAAGPAGIQKGRFFLYHRLPFRRRPPGPGDHPKVGKAGGNPDRGGLRHDRIDHPLSCQPLGRKDQGGLCRRADSRHGLQDC